MFFSFSLSTDSNLNLIIKDEYHTNNISYIHGLGKKDDGDDDEDERG